MLSLWDDIVAPLGCGLATESVSRCDLVVDLQGPVPDDFMDTYDDIFAPIGTHMTEDTAISEPVSPYPMQIDLPSQGTGRLDTAIFLSAEETNEREPPQLQPKTSFSVSLHVSTPFSWASYPLDDPVDVSVALVHDDGHGFDCSDAAMDDEDMQRLWKTGTSISPQEARTIAGRILGHSALPSTHSKQPALAHVMLSPFTGSKRLGQQLSRSVTDDDFSKLRSVHNPDGRTRVDRQWLTAHGVAIAHTFLSSISRTAEKHYEPATLCFFSHLTSAESLTGVLGCLHQHLALAPLPTTYAFFWLVAVIVDTKAGIKPKNWTTPSWPATVRVPLKRPVSPVEPRPSSEDALLKKAFQLLKQRCTVSDFASQINFRNWQGPVQKGSELAVLLSWIDTEYSGNASAIPGYTELHLELTKRRPTLKEAVTRKPQKGKPYNTSRKG